MQKYFVPLKCQILHVYAVNEFPYKRWYKQKCHRKSCVLPNDFKLNSASFLSSWLFITVWLRITNKTEINWFKSLRSSRMTWPTFCRHAHDFTSLLHINKHTTLNRSWHWQGNTIMRKLTILDTRYFFYTWNSHCRISESSRSRIVHWWAPRSSFLLFLRIMAFGVDVIRLWPAKVEFSLWPGLEPAAFPPLA